MRSYHHIDLGAQSVRTETLEGEDIVRAGRYLIAKTLNEENIAKVDPLSPENPLIFSAGPFAGTNFFQCQSTQRGMQESVDRRHKRS